MERLASMLCITLLIGLFFGCTIEENDDTQSIKKSTNTTGESGSVMVEYVAGTLQIQVVDFDSGVGLSGIQVTAIELADGLVIWAADQSSAYYPSSVFIRFTDVKSTTIRLASEAVANNIGYRYAIEPSGFEAIFAANLQQTCVSGNLLDIANSQLFGNLESGSIIEISGAPADLTGQTAIYVGFSKAIIEFAAQTGNLNTIFNNTSGILSTDTLNFCWLNDGAQTLPYLKVEVLRQSVGFNITNIDHLNFYPYFPTRAEMASKISFSWVGNPVLPLILSYTSVSCDPKLVCSTTEVNNLESNPVVDNFGCYGVGPTSSEFNVWRVTLTDSVGNKTDPATFSMRCGNDPNLNLQAEEIKVVSSQWGTKNWAPTNVFQTSTLPNAVTYSFDSFPNAPTPNVEVLDFDITVDNGVITEIIFGYHNTGIDPGSLIAPPKYVYKLDCITTVCVDVVYLPQSRRFVLNDIIIPAIPGSPTVDNNFATGDVRVSGILSW